MNDAMNDFTNKATHNAMHNPTHSHAGHHGCDVLRRALLSTGLLGPAAALLGRPAHAADAVGAANATGASGALRAPAPGRILVVLELSGGNDGLNTVVPYTDDTYHRLRPTLAIPATRVRRLDANFGLNPGMAGLQRLYQDGRLAIVHGCGYAQPSFSHFASMAYWHTAAPNSGEATGWIGRLADALQPVPQPNFLINVADVQSLAVRAQRHVPVVFDDPERFVRTAWRAEPAASASGGGGGGGGGASSANTSIATATATATGAANVISDATSGNASRRFLREVDDGARAAAEQVRRACSSYRSPVDYGLIPLDLQKVAALIDARMPARLYYVAYRNNAFDTHVHQADTHQRLLTYVSDAVSGFLRDMERIGRADDVVLMAFSEFGRRVAENANLGTDHGTAGPMFIAGKPVRGGLYGQPPSLLALGADGNMAFTTDFRRVYATLAQRWLGLPAAPALLRGSFEPLPVFG